MSGVIGGSGYGLGAYGKGPYGYATRVLGIWGASRGRVAAQPIVQAALNIESATVMAVGAEQLWAPIAVAPCQPWGPIGTPGCWQAIPNNAGAMFPALE